MPRIENEELPQDVMPRDNDGDLLLPVQVNASITSSSVEEDVDEQDVALASFAVETYAKAASQAKTFLALHVTLQAMQSSIRFRRELLGLKMGVKAREKEKEGGDGWS